MRLAFITSQAFSLSNFRGPLIVALVSRGVEVFAIAPDFDDETRKKVTDLGAVPYDCSFSRTGMNPFSDLLGMINLFFLLRRLKLDICFSYSIKPVIFGTLAALIAGVRRRFCLIEGLGYVFTNVSGFESLKRRLLRKLVIALYRISLQFAERVFLLNPDDYKDLISFRILTPKQAVFLDGIGLDLSMWCQRPNVKFPLTFIMAARLLREKGVFEYFEAAKLVKAKFAATKFILLGSIDPNPGGVSRGEIEKYVSEGSVEWPGHVVVDEWISNASVFVLPSYYREGLPRSTQEAMAMGRPIITTDVPGCRETVVEGVNGFLIPPRNVKALVGAMLRFIECPLLVEEMGMASRAMAVARFDVHLINFKILENIGIEKSSYKSASKE